MFTLGGHYFLAKLISPYAPSGTIALMGMVAQLVILLGYMYFTHQLAFPRQRRYWLYALGIGALLAVGNITLYQAVQAGPVSVVMPIYGFNAVVTALLGIVFLKEPLKFTRVCGIVLAAGAIILLSQ